MHVHDLRSFLESVRKAGDLHEIRREVDPVRELGRVLAACERAGKAAYFHAVKGFDIPVVGSLLSSPKRIALALECEVPQIGERMAAATEKPIPSAPHSGKAPCQEIVVKKPDLTKWPIPTHSPLDAGPFVGTSHRPDKDVTLAPGMGLCVEIHPCSEDVIKGVVLGDTYVITETGARSVNKLAPELYVV